MSKKKKKGNFFTNLFFEDVPEKGTSAEQPAEEATSKGGGVPTQTLDFASNVPEQFRTKPIGSNVSQGIVKGGFSEDFYNHFQNEIEKSDLEGADYFEFRKMYDALKDTMPEATAINAAFQALKATSPNLTVERLIETAQIYIGVVEQEESDFQAQLNAKVATEIDGRQTEIEEQLQLQEELQSQIEELKTKIVDSQQTVGVLEGEKQAKQTEIDQVSANFTYTSELVKNNINTDIANIENFLVGTKTA